MTNQHQRVKCILFYTNTYIPNQHKNIRELFDMHLFYGYKKRYYLTNTKLFKL